MQWLKCLSLAVTAALLIHGPSLEAQDQLVRPARFALDPAAEQGSRPASGESLAERGSDLPVSGGEDAPGAFRAEESPDRAAAVDSLAVPLKKGDDPSERRAGRDGLFGGPVATITGGLAVTLGLFAVVVALARRGGGASLKGLPREAFEVIGQTPIGPRQRLLVVRAGTQAMVIGTSPAGIHPIAQIDDPDEAGQLIAQCRGMGAEAAFKSTLYELEQQRTAPGFVDDPATSSGRSKRSSLFLRA